MVCLIDDSCGAYDANRSRVRVFPWSWLVTAAVAVLLAMVGGGMAGFSSQRLAGTHPPCDHGEPDTLAQGTASELPAVAPSSAPTPRRRAAAARPVVTSHSPLIVVRALGPVPRSRLRLACRSLLESLPVRCEIRAPRRLSAHSVAWVADREQYDGRTILEQMFADREVDAHVELLLTSRDLYERDKAYVFGLANLSDRVAVISTARIEDGTWRAEHRLTKLVQHEVGHTFGLGHHHDPGCVMRTDGTPASLDTAPLVPCERCRTALVDRVHELAGREALVLDRARAHRERGELAMARAWLARL